MDSCLSVQGEGSAFDRRLYGGRGSDEASPRLQTVFPQTNPHYHRLIEQFGQATGVPVLMNTSLWMVRSG